MLSDLLEVLKLHLAPPIAGAMAAVPAPNAVPSTAPNITTTTAPTTASLPAPTATPTVTATNTPTTTTIKDPALIPKSHFEGSKTNEPTTRRTSDRSGAGTRHTSDGGRKGGGRLIQVAHDCDVSFSFFRKL